MIHISSEDFTSGTRSNGTWSLSRPIAGTYKVLYQSIEIADIPWITIETNSISIQYSASPSVVFYLFLPIDLPTYQMSTNLANIATYIETRFNTIFVGLGYGISVTVTTDADNDRFVLTFTSNITIQWDSSSCASIFKQSGNPHAMVHYMSYKNINVTPSHLYMKVDESVSTLCTSDSDIDATILFHLSDGSLPGQALTFRQATNTLNISFFRASYPEEATELDNKWELVLMPG